MSRLKNVEALRQGILILLGVLFMVSGASILYSPIPEEYIRMDPSIQAHLNLLGVSQIGWMFVAAGAFSALCGAFDRHVIGYFSMMGLSMFWGLLYVVSWLDTGYARALFGAAQYALFVGVLFLSSRAVVLPPPLVEKLTAEVSDGD